MKKFALATAFAAMAISPLTQAADYVIDTEGAHAFIQFRVSHLGYSFVEGRFNTFAGTFSFDDKNVAAAKIELTIDTKSVDSNHAARDKHLRSGDFLNVDKHDKATFVSTKIVPKTAGQFDVVGNFTFNGITKEITINAQKVGEGQDPWGGYRAGFTGTSAINLSDFAIKNILGPKAETVALSFVVEGVRK